MHQGETDIGIVMLLDTTSALLQFIQGLLHTHTVHPSPRVLGEGKRERVEKKSVFLRDDKNQEGSEKLEEK